MRLITTAATAALFLSIGTTVAAAQPVSTDSPRAAIARTYLDALVSHDASAVPFAPDATRVEMGLQTGSSGPGLSNELNYSILNQTILGTRDITFVEHGDTVTAYYLLDAGLGGTRMTTVRITEKFVIPVDKIQYIEANIQPFAE
ncbi:hypothetical protein [Nocardia camponoti]|uniref:DUF8021 domain-containing protein n=1 Tax=Nocardia camponoti TaxID=1616106 RepID=A0A917QD21_9NOCA|nr:hypothetical protein [Nocardia camponoti]GGK44771.1 hypothetical protein GCM10011591_15450 [Nocardia camponoti]